MKKVFVCSALRGDMENNLRKAKEYCRWVAERGAVPIAPHLLFPQFLDDRIDAERRLGIRFGLELLRSCDELWYFGNTVTEGMRQEIGYAGEHGIPVRYIENGLMEMQHNESGGMQYV